MTAIHRFACLDHQHYLPGTGKGVRHVLKVIKGYQVLMRMVPHDLLCDSGAAVITAHLKSVISHIQGKTSSHNGKTYDSNIKFYHSSTSQAKYGLNSMLGKNNGNSFRRRYAGAYVQELPLFPG